VLVFVSHSSRDKELVVAFTTLLTECGLVSAGELFVSSIDGYDVKDGDDFLEDILQAGWDSTPQASTRVEARVGQAVFKLLKVTEHIRDAGWLAVTREESEPSRVFTNALREVARAICDLLHDTTGSPIRVAVKQLVTIKEEGGDGNHGRLPMWVQDLARDNPNDVRSGMERVDSNSDFREILLGSSEFFASNRLSQLEGYENSHFPDRSPTYESTIVWPIRKIDEDVSHKKSVVPRTFNDFLGFLCVDSTEPDAFTKYDRWLVGILAAELFLPMRLWTLHESLPLPPTTNGE